MQTPLTTGVFWQQLTKSGLLSSGQIASVSRDLAKRKIHADTDAAAYLVRRGILTQYQVDRLLEGRSRGFFFDQYRVLDLLGAGGMGWVYRAADSRTNEVVALKVLLDRHKEDRGMLARFQQEARAGQVLNHPHIVRTRSTGSAGGLLYMILDFVEGPSLLELLLRCRRLPWAQACDMARQAALGLDHAHRAGWVHRDVKPQNLLLDRQGHLKLLDFGLAMMREGEGGDEFSMAMIFGHECIGTPAYMAPEQATDSLTADGRSDIYGLGCTLFAALTGDTPFPLRTPAEVVKAHQTQPPRSVRDLVPEIPVDVARIVAKMLAKNPDERYQTAAEVAAALEPWSRAEPLEFDFKEILTERTQNALDRVAELHKSRPVPSGSASSTTRLTKLSSVAQTRRGPVQQPAGEGQPLRGDSTVGDPARSPAILDRQVPVATDGALPEFFPPRHGKMLVSLGDGTAIPLVSSRILVGRAEDADLRIPESSVSGRHCELHFDGTWWWITDLNSRNGTRVNGKPVLRRQLSDGDVISVGNTVRLRLADVGETNSSPPAKPKRTSFLLLGLVTLACVIGVLTVIFFAR